jgi:O-acetyl-ADP-ribose deacetylase (regulator of RNase III)
VQGGFFTSPAAVLVNTVNTVGIMGKGIAKEFKAIYPEMFAAYQDACERDDFRIGSLLLYRAEHKSVLNFPTKRHWKQRAQLLDIEAGLKTFVQQYEQLGIGSIAFPQLGCGNGELDWESQVRPLMERYLGSLPIDIYIHIYDGDRGFVEHRDIKAMRSWLRNEPRALGFEEVWSDLADVTRSGMSLDEWDVSMPDAGAIHFQSGDHMIALVRDDALDLWQQLRSYGLLSVEDIPMTYEPIAEPILALLERLPYIAKTEFITLNDLRADENQSVADGLERTTSRGVRLVTWDAMPDSPGQLTFFDHLSVA